MLRWVLRPSPLASYPRYICSATGVVCVVASGFVYKISVLIDVVFGLYLCRRVLLRAAARPVLSVAQFVLGTPPPS